MASPSENLRGALLMSLCTASFALGDTTVKAIMQDIPFSQAVFIRGILTTVIIGTWAYLRSELSASVSPRDRKWIVLRVLGEVLGAYFYVSALQHMPLANATAILQALPLCVALAAAIFFGERLGRGRMGAIAIGGVGVMLILRPGPDGFDIFALSAFMGVLCVVFRELATRQLSVGVPSFLVAFWTSVGIIAMGLASSVGDDWIRPSTQSILLFPLSALSLVAAYMFSIMAMRIGDLGFTAPFRYTSMIWALMLGLVVFGHFPDALTLVGAAIVIATGLFTLLREARLRKRHENV